MKRSADEWDAKRREIEEMAVRIVANHGWDAFSNRRTGAMLKIDRSTFGKLFSGEYGQREAYFMGLAFGAIRDVASDCAKEKQVNIVVIQTGLLKLFSNTDMPALLFQCCRFAGVSCDFSEEFAAERDKTLRHLESCCVCPPDRVRRLLNWYIAASAARFADDTLEISELRQFGAMLGNIDSPY